MRIECGTGRRHRYELAGIEVVTDSPWEEFEPFRTSPADATRTAARRTVAEGAIETRRTRGMLAGIEREITATWRADSVELRCAGSRLEMDFGEEEIILRGSTRAELDRELIAGPGLLLGLTAAGRLTLHASAAVVGAKTLLFAGHSGAGKSTLARAFGGAATADDLIAVDVADWRHWPRLPQRKWAFDRQQALPRVSGGLVWLVLVVDREVDDPALEPLSAAEALKTWLAHTAASRLYSQVWQRAWLEHCTAAAQSVPAFLLRVPWRLPDAADNAERTADFLRGYFAEPA